MQRPQTRQLKSKKTAPIKYTDHIQQRYFKGHGQDEILIIFDWSPTESSFLLAKARVGLPLNCIMQVCCFDQVESVAAEVSAVQVRF